MFTSNVMRALILESDVAWLSSSPFVWSLASLSMRPLVPGAVGDASPVVWELAASMKNGSKAARNAVSQAASIPVVSLMRLCVGVAGGASVVSIAVGGCC